MATNEEQRLMASMAGTNVAFWKINSELWRLFNKALDEGYTPDRLLAESKNTNWYKQHAESVRKLQALKVQEPGEYKRRLAASQVNVRSLAAQWGIPVKNLDHWARLALVNQWSEAELRYHMGSTKRVREQVSRGAGLGGELGKTLTRLKASAYANGVRLSNNQLATFMSNIAAGTTDETWATDFIQRKAISAFPGLAEELKAGMTVRDYAEDYLTTYAELLELNQADVDLFNKDIRDALNAKGKDGKTAPLSLSDFERRIKGTKKWLKTDNAQDSMMEATHAVTQAFGLTW